MNLVMVLTSRLMTFREIYSEKKMLQLMYMYMYNRDLQLSVNGYIPKTLNKGVN